MGINLWSVRFDTVRPMAAFPALQVVAAERQTGPEYRHEGRFRAAERHCLFKYSLSGRGVFRDGRGEHAVPAGYGFLCEIRDPATAYYYPADAREPWEFVYLCFFGVPATAMTREFTARYGPVFEVPARSPFVLGLLQWARHSGRRVAVGPADGARVVADLFEALAAGAQAPGNSVRGSELTGRAIRVMEAATGRNLNIKQLAQELGVSREHLTRVFREETGSAPYAYLLRERIHEACRLLKETDLPNKEVAARLGYDTAPHFNRTFRRLMRMSPLAFRRVGTLPVR